MRTVLLALLLATGCRVEWGPPGGGGAAPVEGALPTGEVWIYTSMYQSVIDAIDPQIRAKYPGLEPKWYQAGSEKVAQKVEAEWAAGGSRACLLMTSDPFWYVELKEQGRLAPYLTPTVLRVDRDLIDADGYWATSRISLMVLAANERLVPPEDRPERFADLTDPRYRDRFSMGDPLASGTNFTTIAFWQREGGWELLKALRDNGLIAAGGNSAVLTRMETGERPIGIVLLENLLAAGRKGSPTVPVFPKDGAIAIPGPIAVTTGCGNPVGAKAVYDFIMSEQGQQAIVAGDMYAGLPELAPPTGAPPLSEIAVRRWPEGFAEQVVHEKAELKRAWADLIAGGSAP